MVFGKMPDCFITSQSAAKIFSLEFHTRTVYTAIRRDPGWQKQKKKLYFFCKKSISVDNRDKTGGCYFPKIVIDTQSYCSGYLFKI